jgi:hypothetical protein
VHVEGVKSRYYFLFSDFIDKSSVVALSYVSHWRGITLAVCSKLQKRTMCSIGGVFKVPEMDDLSDCRCVRSYKNGRCALLAVYSKLQKRTMCHIGSVFKMAETGGIWLFVF